MSLSALKKVAAIPQSPLRRGRQEDWPVVERILGFELPGDYKDLITMYGSTSIRNFIYLLSPFAPFSSPLNLLSGKTVQLLSSYNSGQKEYPQYSPPFPAHPKPEGLFPWASTINGDTLFWLMKGKPAEWPTVTCDSKFSEDYEVFQLSATDFLAGWIRHLIAPKLFPDNLPENEPFFVPYESGEHRF